MAALPLVVCVGTLILFLHGDHDPLAPIAHAREAAAPGGWKLHKYAGATHALAVTHAPILERQVAEFLTC